MLIEIWSNILSKINIIPGPKSFQLRDSAAQQTTDDIYMQTRPWPSTPEQIGQILLNFYIKAGY